MTVHQEQLKLWDEWIREGQAAKVRSLCRQLNRNKIPRENLLDYAQIARRVGAPDLIVVWLNSVVRPQKILQQPATEKEKAIYALGLLRLGAFREAGQLLSEIDPESDPQIYFYRASLNINQWAYRKALPDLKRYLKNPLVNAYSQFVGRLNYCAALVATKKFALAESEIFRLLKKLEKNNHALLKGNLLEIRSQMYLDQGKISEGLRSLEEAAGLVTHADSRSSIFVKKWQLILRLTVDADPTEALNEMNELKTRALEAQDWETLRECDFYRALALKDQELIQKVYWGSRSPSYRQRIKEKFAGFSVTENYLLSNGYGGNPLNLVNLAPTPILKRFFFVMTRDFYQPLRITEIFGELYPQEYYHPQSGPAKLHRIVIRARSWLKENGIPVEIVSYRNAYKLKIQENCRLVVENKFTADESIDMPKVTEAEFFMAREWAAEKAVSLRTAQNQILKLVQEGKAEAIDHGPKTKYRLLKSA